MDSLKANYENVMLTIPRGKGDPIALYVEALEARVEKTRDQVNWREAYIDALNAENKWLKKRLERIEGDDA
jgi:hypothetical protein